MEQVAQFGTPVYLTGSGTICAGPCGLIGYHVNNTSSGTMIIAANGAAITGTITPGTGFTAFPASCIVNASVTIGGTLDVTFFVQAGTS